MIDTHAHLDACADRPSALIRRARSAGVDRIVTVGTGIESCHAALELAQLHEEVFAALGIDPHQAGDAEAGRVDELRELLEHEEAVAVGETGLDYFREGAPRDRQRKLFEAQLELATELGKPVVIHTRDADTDTADVLAGFDGTVVMHCFSSPGLVQTVVDRGYYVSFAGNVTYPKAADLRAAAAQIPAERILAATPIRRKISIVRALQRSILGRNSGAAFCSTSMQRTPRRPRSTASVSPTGPPPTINTSVCAAGTGDIGP